MVWFLGYNTEPNTEDFKNAMQPVYDEYMEKTGEKGKEAIKEIKLQANITDEHRCKNPQQNTSKQNQSTFKGSYTMINWGLSQECKDSSIYANQSI